MEQVPQVGDWVRFYRDGRLVIAEVAYVVSDPLIGRLRLNTTEGSIDADGALEVRSRV